jgi:DNA-directed RNA polymerase subunit H (RpoH/RPB5)
MVSIPKVVGVLSCGALLCLGLFQAAHAADQEGASRLEQAKVIKGDLVRIDYGDYIVKDKDGKEVIVHVDRKTQTMGQITKGDRVEAKVDEQNHALSIRSLP